MSEPLTVKSSVIFTETEYGGALLDDRTGQYWQLNATSAAIFKDLRSGLDTDTVVRRLIDRFDGVDVDTASADTTALINDLRSRGVFL